VCNWWRDVHTISPLQIQQKLTEHNLYFHLERYDQIPPGESRPFSKLTPFISTTAGVVERDQFFARNLVRSAFITALSFATDWFTQPGFIFYGYLLTLGKKSIPFDRYAEEVRELNTYTSFLRFHDEGELVAKILIPSHHLQRVERWDPPLVIDAYRRGLKPAPTWQFQNPGYEAPDKYSNIKELIL
jgi:hypothetical protein